MTTQEVISRMKVHKPRSVDDLLNNCGFTLKLVGDGSFRYVYEIVGTKLVVKVPCKEDFSISRRHAEHEFKAWDKIMRSKKKYKILQAFMPDIHYFSFVSGITVMKRYRRLRDNQQGPARTSLSKYVAALMKVDSADIRREDNYGLDGKQLKITDMGCFIGGVSTAWDG